MAIKQSPTWSSGPSKANKAQNGADDNVPTAKEMAKAGEVEIFDKDSKPRKLSSFFEAKDGVPQKYLVVFIRHFFCGICQEYTRRLSSTIPPSSLPPNTNIFIIGCGQPSLLANYATETQCAYPIYADPSKRLHQILRMIRTLELGQQTPEFLSHTSMSKITLRSIWQELKSGRQMLSGGSYSQVGGEFLFEVGADGEVKPTWCHRMQSTRDHTELNDIKKVLGMSSENEGDTLASQSAGTSSTEHQKAVNGDAAPNTERKKRWSSIGGASGGIGRRLSKRNRTKSWQIGSSGIKGNAQEPLTNGATLNGSATKDTSTSASTKDAEQEREVLSRLREEPEHQGQADNDDALAKLVGASPNKALAEQGDKGAHEGEVESTGMGNGVPVDSVSGEGAKSETLLHEVAAVKEEKKSQLLPDITAYQKEGSVEPEVKV